MYLIHLHSKMGTTKSYGDYTNYYEILQTCKQIKIVSKASIIATMRGYAASLKKVGKGFRLINDDELVKSGLTRLRRAGWSVIGIMEDTFVLEGYMPIAKRQQISRKRN